MVNRERAFIAISINRKAINVDRTNLCIISDILEDVTKRKPNVFKEAVPNYDVCISVFSVGTVSS